MRIRCDATPMMAPTLMPRTLTVASGRLSISDASYFYDAPVILDFPRGTADIVVTAEVHAGHRHVVRVVLLASSPHPRRWTRGALLGKVLVDFAQIGVGDRVAVASAFDALGDAGMSLYFEKLQTEDDVFWIELPSGVSMLAFRSGFGDGLYPVFDLVDDAGDRVGVEIDCTASVPDV